MVSSLFLLSPNLILYSSDPKIRRMKIACHRWRLDYQREMEKRYDATFMAIESRYMTEIKALFVELAERREKEAVTKLLMEEKARGDAEAKEAEKARREKQRQKEEVEALRLEEGQRSLEDVRATLFKLWSAVEASAEEKNGWVLTRLIPMLGCVLSVPLSISKHH